MFESDNYQKTDIVLTLCPPWDVTTPPVGIGYIMAHLKHQGLFPQFIDLNILLYHALDEGLRNLLWEFESGFKEWEQKGYRIMGKDFETHVDFCVNRLLHFNSNIFGFSLYHANISLSVEIARRIKRTHTNSIIIFGGPSCGDPFDRANIPSDVPDYIVNGEGEQCLTEILRLLNCSKDPLSLPEVSKPHDKFNSETKCLLPDLNKIPFPTYVGFPIDLYIAPKTLRIISSRGCIAKCNFCNENYYTGRYRYRNAYLILEEILFHKSNYGVESFIFSDQEINGNIEQLDLLCSLIIKEGIKLQWCAQAIPMKKLTLSVLKKMKKAGCNHLDFGLESGSSTVLKRMGKPFTRDNAKLVLEWCHKAQITTGINIIVGFPGESEEEMRETMDFLRENRSLINRVSNISTCFIKPFSDLFFNPRNYGIYIPDKAYFWYEWEDHSNIHNKYNHERSTKVSRIIDLCNKCNIPVGNKYVFP